jgi:hypothetical protein
MKFLYIRREWLETGEGEMFLAPPPLGEPILPKKKGGDDPCAHQTSPSLIAKSSSPEKLSLCEPDSIKRLSSASDAAPTFDPAARLDITIKVSTAEFQLLAAAASHILLEEYVKSAAIGLAQLSCRCMGMKLNEKGMLCE